MTTFYQDHSSLDYQMGCYAIIWHAVCTSGGLTSKKKKKKKKQIEESLESGNQNSQGPEEMKDGQTVTQV